MLRCTGFGRHRRPRQLRFEVLESRALMSPFSAPAPVEGVQLLELESAEPEPGDESESVAISELPPAVLDSFGSRFPQGVILEATADTTEDPLEYQLRTEIQGTTYTASLLADGMLVEIQRSMAIAELPAPLRAWLSDQFPNATIESAAQVTEDGTATIEVVLGVAGQSSLELTLQLADIDPNPGPGDLNAAGEKPISGGNLPQSGGAENERTAPNAAIVEHGVTPGDSSNLAGSVSGSNPSAPLIRSGDSRRAAEDGRVVSQPASGSRLTVNLTAPKAANSPGAKGSVRTSERLPAAEILSDARFIDFPAIEQAMEQFLNGFERLAESVGGTRARGWWPNFAALAALVGIERLTRNRLRTESDTVFAAGSSWSWILRLSTLK